MPRFALKAGAEIDILSAEELRKEMMGYFNASEAAKLRGLKPMRLPESLYGKAASSKLSLGVEQGNDPVGPALGYIWSITRLIVTGLTTGATPDIVNIYRNTANSQPIWQLNGNSFGVTFGKLQLTLNGGDTLALASVGTFAATGQIVLSGELIEVPAELIGKLA